MQLNSDISIIRELEDCIRSTKRYIKLVKSRHEPSQSNGSPILLFTESYLVYTGNESNILFSEKKILEAFVKMYNWFMSEAVTIHLTYDYRDDKASVRCSNCDLDSLCEVIPGFKDILKKITIREIVNEETSIKV